MNTEHPTESEADRATDDPSDQPKRPGPSQSRMGTLLMKDLAEELVKTLVDSPEEVNVSSIGGEQSTVIEVRVSATDLGLVIGRQGHTVRALRTILSSVAAKDNKRVILDIIE
jgi:predicted RNA-binding protein YlqC (UPF0109 family)